MRASRNPHRTFPAHVVALCALAGVAALLAYAMYDRAPAARTAAPERPRAAETSRVDLESWATSAQQKALGIGAYSLTARESRGGVASQPLAAPAAGELIVTERPMTRTVTHVGTSPRRAEAPRARQRDSWSYAAPSLANLPAPGD